LGGAAAAGAGLAVAGSTLMADPAGATAVTAGAAEGDALQICGPKRCSNATSLTASTGNAFFAQSSSAQTIAIKGEADNGNGAVGVFGSSGTGYGLVGLGARAALWLEPSSSVGAPTTGTHQTGEFVVDLNGTLFICVVAGTPGTWVNLTSGTKLVPVNPPARVYDSRNGGGALGNGVTRNVTVTGTFGASTIPTGISAVLCNLTCANPVGAGYLAMFEAGKTWSGTSNINYNNGQNISNNVTSAVSAASPGQVAVLNGGLSTDFIIDVFGYYP